MIRVTRNEICTCIVKIKVAKDYPEEILINVYRLHVDMNLVSITHIMY